MTARHASLAALPIAAILATACATSGRTLAQAADTPLRVATYNVSLYDDADGGVIRRLEAGDEGARKVAAVLQRLRPDLVLLNEFDHDAEGCAADLFQQRYLEVPQTGGGDALHYPHRYFAPVNTGEPSGLDLDGNGSSGGAGRDRGNDAWGYGLHPGQYGMLVLSRYPIERDAVRSFRLLRWSAMPDAIRPYHPTQRGYFHRDEIWQQLRLSSKSHWDVPVRTPLGRLHFLVSHPTPPVFDGPEDRNGARNADELRLWREYLDNDPADHSWLCDDQGRCGGLAEGERFVIAGDLNNDPNDGDGRHDAIRALIDHPRVLRHPAPRSEGAAIAAGRAGGANTQHVGDPAEDTGDFGPRVGNLRLDYVLPSTGLRWRSGGVFWPAPDSADAAIAHASDHHAVWVDLLFDD
ncbi:endonuclease/exonuclease/phosphatase family protein [Lysobacter brunescens]|uniref:Endonuclease/exonuclease/phosphatase family protein n=1 Tax=Lysobacter brunescens TaxID=262323 RepID=A0ABW2YGQ9_9GAMM